VRERKAVWTGRAQLQLLDAGDGCCRDRAAETDHRDTDRGAALTGRHVTIRFVTMRRSGAVVWSAPMSRSC
jgi:hypothetical protein